MNNIFLKNYLIDLSFNSNQNDLNIIQNKFENFDIENFDIARTQRFHFFNFQNKDIKIAEFEQENKIH